MYIIHSSGRIQNGTVIWNFDKNEIEFTSDEFIAITDALKERGLWEVLGAERPALKSRLESLYRNDFSDIMEYEDFAFQAEQSLLGLRGILRI